MRDGEKVMKIRRGEKKWIKMSKMKFKLQVSLWRRI